jgi:hypothetical protein
LENLQVKAGCGKIQDSSLNLTEVLWVGPECLRVFTGSPSLLKISENEWLLSHDFFGATTFNDTKQIYWSGDNGETWQYRSNITGIYWSNIFNTEPTKATTIYMLGTAGDDIHKVSPPNTVPLKGGPVVITQSTDQGKSWSSPTVLFHGSFQTAPTPVILVNGTYFRSMEDSAVTTNLIKAQDRTKKLFLSSSCGPLMMWAKQGSDLMQPSSWSRSRTLDIDQELSQIVQAQVNGTSWQEGSAIEAPSGEVWNILRVNGQSPSFYNKAVVTVLDVESKTLKFKQFIDGPFGSSKFVIRRDYNSQHAQNSALPAYYAMSTNVTEAAAKIGTIGARNNLVLSVSSDLLHWKVCSTLLQDDSGFTPEDSAKFTGFEYPDWVFDGDDIVAGIRTAYRGAVSDGSSNRITSIRVADFRTQCSKGP